MGIGHEVEIRDEGKFSKEVLVGPWTLLGNALNKKWVALRYESALTTGYPLPA